MDKIKIKPVKRINGIITVPPDKSISHRAIMFGSLAYGVTKVKNFLAAEDCLNTIKAFQAMGIRIKVKSKKVKGKNKNLSCEIHNLEIYGKGLRGLKKPDKDIYCGNSGTAMRLLSGILSGQDFKAILTGDESLTKRPMARIAAPLRLMGAEIQGDFPPLIIHGGNLNPIDYVSPVASAQVKSCILLAGLYANGTTSVVEPLKSRDHTERMLRLFNVKIKESGLKVSIKGNQQLKAIDIEVPADISSAAFFIIAALIVKGSKLKIKSVGLNPTRTGILDVLKQMGAKIKIVKKSGNINEPMADMIIESSSLKAVTIESKMMPRLIDELPIIMIAATQAEGITRIMGAKELRVKETDRIKSMASGLIQMGADITVHEDNIFIKGPTMLKGATLNSFGDHRTAMSFAVAGLIAEGSTVVEDTSCVLTSFPNFNDILSDISQY